MKTKIVFACIVLAAIFTACKNSGKPESEQEYVKDWETEGVALGLTPTEYEMMTPEEIERRHQALILSDYLVVTIEDSLLTKDNIPEDRIFVKLSISEDEAEALGVSREYYRQQLDEIEKACNFAIEYLENGEQQSWKVPNFSKEDSDIGNREKLLEREKFFTQGAKSTE